MKKAIKTQRILVLVATALALVASGCVGTIYPEEDQTGDKFTINASSGDCASISPYGQVQVDAGGNITFTITPNPDQTIEDVWIDGQSVGAVLTYTFSGVMSDHQIVVVCPGQQVLDVVIEGSGQVVKNPAGPTYALGTVVTLTAVPDTGWTFDHWEGDAAGADNIVLVTMDQNRSVKAYFVPNQSDQFILSVSQNGSGSVSKSPDQASYQSGSTVSLTATAAAGFRFDHWEGDLTGAQNPAPLLMDRNKAVTAFFVPDGDKLALNLTTNGSGTVVKYPDQPSYSQGTVVTVTAMPAAGWVFSRWEGDILGSDTTVLVTMDATKTATAFFVEESQQFTVNAGVSGLGTVAKNPDLAAYDPGTLVTLTATAQAGWVFDHWEGDATGVQNPLQLTVDGDKTVTAFFVEQLNTLDVTVVGSGSVTKNPDRPSYSSGTVVTLTAVAGADWEFDHWEGGLTGNQNPGQLTIMADTAVVAHFVQPVEDVSILLVDDDDGANHEAAYRDALSANGFEFTVWAVKNQGSPGLSTLQDHDIVVWHVSEQYDDTLSSEDQKNLKSYLDCGGRLFLSGQDMTWEIGDTDFVTEYLQVTDWSFVGTDSLQSTDDEISSGLGTVSLSYPFTDHTDGLTIGSAATASFKTTGNEPCGIKIARGKYRAVFFAFPFEAVANADASKASTVMNNVISWLAEDMSNEDTPPTVAFTYPTANEVVAGYVNVTVDTGGELCLSKVDYRVDGGQWVEVVDPPYTWFWDSREVSNGMHTLEAQAYSRGGQPSNIASVTIEVDQEAVGPVAKYAVVAGVSDYPGGGDLSYCDEDASDWYHYLVGHGYQVWVYGDGHENDFPKYDGDATVSNMRAAVRNVMSLADDNDIVVITMSGHGAGSGGDSFWCAYDGNYYDNEVAEDVATGNAGQVFVFFDSCFSGGMGPELINLSTSSTVYVSTTCSDNGYGYDEGTYQNGAWTHWFLNAGLTDQFNNTNVSMEDGYQWADGQYNPGGGDEPEEYDSNTGMPFHLDFPPAKNAWYQESKPEPVDLFAGESLRDLVHGFASVELARQDQDGVRQRATPQKADVKSVSRISEIVGMLEPDQLLTLRSARCLFGYSLTFKDLDGKQIGQVGICLADEYQNDHQAVFVAPAGDGHSVVRRGLSVPQTLSLIDTLDLQFTE